MISALRKLFKKSHETKIRPNIVLVLLDQFRTDALGCHPVFEQLKQKGVFFGKAITYAPYTLASCHATFTGMYGRENGVDAYTKSDHYDEKNCFSLADYLSDAGYYTSAYTFSKILIPKSGFTRFNIVSEDDETDVTKSHLDELDRSFLQNKPFFTYLHHGEIHHNVVKDVIKKYSIDDERYFGEDNLSGNKERYQAYAHDAGEYLQSIVSHIKEKDPDGETLIIVMTDHGGSNGEKQGEKAYGSFTYDYSIKIWYYMIWPKILEPGTIINNQVRTIDILPTILEITGIKPKKNKKEIKGDSLIPVINGHDTEERWAYSETGGVDGPFPSPDVANVRCVTDGKWKLIQNTTTNKFELYDLINDPEEEKNLYGVEQDQQQRLWEKMIEYI